MNANELADELENTTRHRKDTVFTQAAAMLRQQQAEIENLKQLTKEPTKLLVVEDVLRQVGYIKLKTLTTEEIKEIAIQHIEKRLDGDRFGYFEFAEAVLKKAQEENNAKS